MSKQDIQDRLDTIRADIAFLQDYRAGALTGGNTKAQLLDAIAEVWDHELGPIDDLAREAGELLGALPDSEPPPPPPPPPAQPWASLQGFTAKTHWNGDPRAIDVYLTRDGVEAPRGVWVPAPLPGRVSKLVTPGPASPLVTAVLTCADGFHLAVTHALDGFGEGQVQAGDPWFQLGDSGIEVFTRMGRRPWHLHFFAYTHAPTPDGMGDRAALDVLRQLGMQPEIVARIPSPDDYLRGRAVAGRFL